MNKLRIFLYLTILTGLTIFTSPKCHKIRINKPNYGRIKTYTKKAPYAGFGKKSSKNGQIKTKPIRGYYKPSNNYKFVNPYTRSR